MEQSFKLNNQFEGIDPKAILEMTTFAREKTWKAIDEISSMIVPGMTEQEAIKKANEYFRAQGVRRFWHRTHVRFGQSTILSFNDDYRKNVVLQKDDIFFIDVGPVWNNIEGDCGKTFALGKNPAHHKIIEDLKSIFNQVQNHWKNTNTSGPDLFKFAEQTISDSGYKMYPSYVKGHRLSEFSHSQYTNMALFDFPDHPAPERWILELQICHPSLKFGAFYEDLLL